MRRLSLPGDATFIKKSAQVCVALPSGFIEIVGLLDGSMESVFIVAEIVGLLDGKVTSMESVLKLALVKGPVPTELKAATAISYRVEGFKPVISMFLMATVSCT